MLQIRQQLELAGLDPTGVQMYGGYVSDLKEQLKAAEEKENRTKEDKAAAKAGKLVIGFWERLLVILPMVYRTQTQGTAPDDSSDFRLVVSKWLERPRFPLNRGRCVPQTD
jgi:hypothetical protein